MDGQKIPILLNCLAALFGAVGQLLYKRGSAQMARQPLNLSLIVGVLLFCVVMGLFVLAYKLGGKISVVYPFYATTFVWGTFIGVWFEGETVRPVQLGGLGMLLIGLVMIASQAGAK